MPGQKLLIMTVLVLWLDFLFTNKRGKETLVNLVEEKRPFKGEIHHLSSIKIMVESMSKVVSMFVPMSHVFV